MSGDIDNQAKARVLSVLVWHEGKANGISAKDLSLKVGVLERDIREIVSALRLEGTAVCAHPAHGYFIAANDQEVTETCEFLYSRAMHSLGIISVLKGVPLPELRGQLRLPT
jgi:biotin operon repressor